MRFLRVGCFLLFCAFLGEPGAWAALGERHQPLDADQSKNAGGAYTIHQTASRFQTLREYVDSNGTVFAVVWEGKQPHLQGLLGRYYAEYQKHFRASHEKQRKESGRISHQSIQTPQVVVESAGTMRAPHGRAYLPDLVPEGVSSDAIQ